MLLLPSGGSIIVHTNHDACINGDYIGEGMHDAELIICFFKGKFS